MMKKYVKILRNVQKKLATQYADIVKNIDQMLMQNSEESKKEIDKLLNDLIVCVSSLYSTVKDVKEAWKYLDSVGFPAGSKVNIVPYDVEGVVTDEARPDIVVKDATGYFYVVGTQDLLKLGV